MDRRLTIQEMEVMRSKVIELINFIESNKARFQSNDSRELMNHFQYNLNHLGNMINIQSVQNSDPYHQQFSGWQSTGPARTVIYNPDGSTKIINASAPISRGEAWESQFDEGLLLKPPNYMLPPQTITQIPQIRR
jgi:hypothetical protein